MKTTNQLKQFALFLFVSLLTLPVLAQDLEKEVDALLNEQFPADGPGATALIYENGEVIYRKAFGHANMELDVEMKPEDVFEIGSITKQFTAVAILMLEEQGKLKVEDQITKFIPDYPTNGKTITIHHLLNHTSGIKSYTNMQSFMEIARVDMTPTELIDHFKNEPMDFDPGERFQYNNSGYILLGHIIAVITGESYAEFIKKHFFDKLGMTNSYYGSMVKLIKNRAYGYQQNNGELVNAAYLSLTLPYAAGSIMSNVDDLLTWQKALNKNTLISRETYEKAINGSYLNNGDRIAYGYGLNDGQIQGSKSIAHGGGIFGFNTMGIYLPAEDVYVAVFSNCNCNSPNGVANKMAALAIGKPFPSIKDAVTLSDSQLNKWLGAYKFEDGAVRHISIKDGHVISLREGSNPFRVYPMSEDEYIFEDGNITYKFSNVNGKKQAQFITGGSTTIGTETNKALPTERTEIQLSEDILKEYVGKYELQPGFILEVTVEGNQIFTQATGQSKIEVYAEAKDRFFLKVVNAQLVFSRNETGEVNMVTLHQGGMEMPGKKL